MVEIGSGAISIYLALLEHSTLCRFQIEAILVKKVSLSYLLPPFFGGKTMTFVRKKIVKLYTI